MNESNAQPALDPEVQRFTGDKADGYQFRQRRQEDWRENYTLYRDKVTLNRLTQRQSVNVPLMKLTVKSILKDVDDMPVLYFENLDNDKQAEVFKNEYWKVVAEKNNLELQDIVDKKQVLLFGRSVDQWQIADGMPKMTVIDPQHILVSRYMNPYDIHSSAFLIHQHIFQPISVLEANPDYDQEAIKELKMWYGTEHGLIKAQDNYNSLAENNKKMSDMGVTDIDNPILGETYVELNLYFSFRKEEGDEDRQIYLSVIAEDMKKLMKKPLEKVIGETSDHFWRTHYPYNSWADDLERQDFWSDGIADIVRTPNKTLNVFYSQLVENRTLRNFNMNVYDTTAADNFMPQTYNPVPWGWFGVPGKPKDVYQKLEVSDLSEAIDEMQYIQTMVERATGATPTQQGAQIDKQVTLGEVKMALGEAKARVKGMSKFYTPVWMQRGLMFTKLIEAAGDKIDAVKIYKKGKNTDNIYSREIQPSDWMTKSGYRCRVWSQDEKNTEDINSLQKLNAAKTIMPDNPKLDEIYKRKTIEFAGLNPDEVNEVMMFEEQKRRAMMSMNTAGMLMPTNPIQQQSKPQPVLPPPSQVPLVQ